MELGLFKQTTTCGRFNFQKCIYLISSKPCDRIGLANPLWMKLGMSSGSSLKNRFRTYQTYWPAGVHIHAVATVKQCIHSDRDTLRDVEPFIVNYASLNYTRVRPRCESFIGLDVDRIVRRL